MKKITYKFLSMFLVLMIFGGITPIKAIEPIQFSVKSIESDDEIYQLNYVNKLKFNVEIESNNNKGLNGNKIIIETNIGDIFNIKDFSNKEIYDINAEKNLIGKVSLKTENNKRFFEILSLTNKASMTVNIDLSDSEVQAKYFNIEEGKSIIKTLVIGEFQKPITIKARESENKGIQIVDKDIFWKNMYPSNDKKSTHVHLHVNPIGSIDLYGSVSIDGSLTNGRNIKQYDSFIVKDEIPEKGIIDENSLGIYAYIPEMAKTTEPHNDSYHGVFLPENCYYAKRPDPTVNSKFKLNLDGPSSKFKKIVQEIKDDYETFYAKIENNDLSYGIYLDKETETSTLLCNFGSIGFNDSNRNNGIKYSDFKTVIPDKLDKYSQIFGDEGPTKGNIVSYVVDFEIYYPNVVGEKYVDNYASCITKTSDEAKPNVKGNTSNECLIDNSVALNLGFTKNSDLSLLLISDKDNKPISNAQFELYKLVNEDYEKMPIAESELLTNEDGKIYIRSLPSGKYKLKQITSDENYNFDNNSFFTTRSDKTYDMTQTGEFEIKKDDKYGYGAIVMNYCKPSMINAAPVIKAKDIEIFVGNKFDPMMGLISATDVEDGNLKDKVEIINNNVNIKKVGTYSLTYTVEDSFGNVTNKTIKVTVKDKEKPSEPEDEKPSETESKPSHKNENHKNEFIVVNTSTK